ncbi:MAG: phosphoribulokinase [Methanomicrobium sp.]|nr:phosphoribulokinase [Methanomicrobium sp.]MDD4299321.1 phosphoribulokinase [Methanomicrobium sp.]
MKNNNNFLDAILKSPCIFIIGVAGDSGSGKTTFTGGVRKIFGDNLVSTITLDDYHTMGREERKRKNITPLSPKANNFELLEEHAALLKAGRAIQKPVYNHKTGETDPPVLFTPTKIIILEGLHTFCTPRLRQLIDFTVFVNPDKNVKYDWKIKRDVYERGYKREDVLAELAAREEDYKKYVEPQSRYADAVIEISDSFYGRRVQNSRNVYKVTLYQEKLDRTVKNINLNFNLFALNSLSSRNFCMGFEHSKKYGKKTGAISLDGEFQYDVIRHLEKSIEDQIKVPPISFFPGKNFVNATDMIMLLLSWRIINKRISAGYNGDDEKFCRRIISSIQ